MKPLHGEQQGTGRISREEAGRRCSSAIALRHALGALVKGWIQASTPANGD
jgi:hypothetical protein